MSAVGNCVAQTLETIQNLGSDAFSGLSSFASSFGRTVSWLFGELAGVAGKVANTVGPVLRDAGQTVSSFVSNHQREIIVGSIATGVATISTVACMRFCANSGNSGARA